MFRAPIGLYRLRLGFVLGRRFLMLEHRGRKTGITRRTVLEVVANDRDTLCVAAAWGERAHWLRNIVVDPNVRIYWGVRRFDTVAARIETERARSVLSEYAGAHPRTFSRLARFMLDDPGDGIEKSVNHLAATVPMVALRKH